jgi:hypothetical protein
MSKKINGTFTLKEILNTTYHSKYENRFEYAERDVLKTIIVVKETTLHPDQKEAPTITYTFRTYSYPQYSPYNKHTKYLKQRKHKHQYDQTLTIEADEDGSFSVNTVNWKYRLGSQRKWDSNPPQSKLKSIKTETKAKWKDQYLFECEKIKNKKISKQEKDKLLKKAKSDYNQKTINQRKKGEYLDSGDYNSRVNGLNGDWVFRCQNTYSYFNHLYGRNTYPEGEIDKIYIFAPKHLIRLLNSLVKLGLIKDF